MEKLIKIYQKPVETDDGIYYETLYKICGSYDDIPDVIVKNSIHKTDSSHMNIDDAIKTLNEIKESGATHVEIDYHCDHDSYIFVGSEIRIATEEEIKEYDEFQKARKKQELERRLSLMEADVEKFKNAINNL